MVRLDPCGFYTRPELIALFAEAGVDWDSLAAKLKVRRVHRSVFRGQDILTAWELAEEIDLSRSRAKPGRTIELPKGRPRRPKGGGKAGDRASEIAQEMKARLGMN